MLIVTFNLLNFDCAPRDVAKLCTLAYVQSCCSSISLSSVMSLQSFWSSSVFLFNCVLLLVTLCYYCLCLLVSVCFCP